jgi:EmrB/QacA subfamily drug resistance transporter
MSRKRIIVVTVGVMLSLFMASMESTVIATAMPTIIGQLGGLEHYSWVFSAFMLASTAAVPLYGKLSDLFGRRRLYLFAMGLFLLGSALSGQAGSMTELIIFRAIQGLGAGGVQPLAFIMIGEMFSLKQRARMQGLFSGVWGVSSIVGPLLGGFLVDQLSWRWVFYVNVIPGLLAAVLVALAWRDQIHHHETPVVDYAGAGLLTASVVALLFGLMELGTPSTWVLITLSVVLFAALLWVERRAADPILPLNLFRDRLFSVAVAHGVLAGWAMFGSTSFVPLFVQSVLGTSATQAGITVTPMLLGWVTASIIGTRLMLKVGYRALGLVGMVSLSTGAFLMSQASVNISQTLLMVFVALMGIGMGLSIPSLLIAVQSSVERRHLGAATSTVQFSRSIGGTLGVSVMGAALTARLTSKLQAAGQDASIIQQLLNPAPGSDLVIAESARLAMANSINLVFTIAFIAALLGLVAIFLAPRHKLTDHAAAQPKEEPNSAQSNSAPVEPASAD